MSEYMNSGTSVYHDGHVVAVCDVVLRAKKIADALNSHDTLVEACEAAVNWIVSPTQPYLDGADTLYKKLQSTVALAKGNQ